MTLRFRAAVRALIIDELDHTLLARFVFPSGLERWALPGGGVNPGETPSDGLRRELHEELGLTSVSIGPHIWNREHVFPMSHAFDGQRDQIHLVRMPRFTPKPAIGWDQMRAEFVHELRWWSADEIDDAADAAFAPVRLGELFRLVLLEGPPETPIDTGA